MTFQQLLKGKRVKKKSNARKNILSGFPQKKAAVQKVITRNPKKPNSAERKVVKCSIIFRKRIKKSKKTSKLAVQVKRLTLYSYVPGEKNTLQEASTVYIQGGGAQDLIGIRTSAIRGAGDFAGVEGRASARSRYGTKKKK